MLLLQSYYSVYYLVIAPHFCCRLVKSLVLLPDVLHVEFHSYRCEVVSFFFGIDVLVLCHVIFELLCCNFVCVSKIVDVYHVLWEPRKNSFVMVVISFEDLINQTH